MSTDRRTFLQLLTAGALTAAFPPSIARALSIPAYCRTGTINDVEHIVIMMQENRSFDHYYGTLTICDAYHCSLFGPTDPNRYYMWTGWVGNDGSGGGPVVDNAEAGYGWSTYPELLQKAGISWKIYQDIGMGLTAAGEWGFTEDAYIGNYGDNSLLYFHQYQNAAAGTPLANGAKTGTDISLGGTLFDIFRQDVASGDLPQVSWVVAPEAYTEHPNWPANYGAWYVSQILDALTDHPDVWSKTAFFSTYDENDGFFDHVVPPTVPQTRAQGLSNVDITNEIFPGSSEYPPGPYGMGIRVPMIVVSPWSKGGWVNSQVFDHTSLIRFIERRFGSQYPGIMEGNITKWRRSVSGDLTSAFNFISPNSATVQLPSTIAYIPPNNQRHPDYVPVPPRIQALPVQESGVRPSRALPYELHVRARTDLTCGTVNIYFGNSGKIDAFLRIFKGSIASDKANIATNITYDIRSNGVVLGIHNRTDTASKVSVSDHYTHRTIEFTLEPNGELSEFWSLDRSSGWYDFTIRTPSDSSFENRLAGHLETGRDSMSDPAIGTVHPKVETNLNHVAGRGLSWIPEGLPRPPPGQRVHNLLVISYYYLTQKPR